MTLVRLLPLQPAPDGVDVAALGEFSFAPTRTRIVDGEVDATVYPPPFSIPIVAGGMDVELAPNDNTWVWKVGVRVRGIEPYTEYVSVPDVEVADFARLTRVDPTTLDPIAEPVPVWYAYVDDLELSAQAARIAAEAAADSIIPSKEASEAAADSASASAIAASSSENAAATSASGAAGSATSASGSATAAAGSATAAASSATAAQGSASAAAVSSASASNDADAASDSAALAVASQEAAEASETAAAASAAAASGSATAAAGSATGAAGSATAASGSATAAGNSATAAAGSATTASTGAATATTKAAEAVAAANGFDIGTTTTGTPGSSAVATITGTAPDRRLNLTIPQGLTGDQSPVVGPANITGTVTLVEADIPSTRLRTMTGNVTFVLPTPSAARSGTITLVLTQDATGGRTITWPAAVKWPDGIAQQPASAANSVSVIHLLWTGTAWLGLLGGKSFA